MMMAISAVALSKPQVNAASSEKFLDILKPPTRELNFDTSEIGSQILSIKPLFITKIQYESSVSLFITEIILAKSSGKYSSSLYALVTKSIVFN
jgi:hypothetical protein